MFTYNNTIIKFSCTKSITSIKYLLSSTCENEEYELRVESFSKEIFTPHKICALWYNAVSRNIQLLGQACQTQIRSPDKSEVQTD